MSSTTHGEKLPRKSPLEMSRIIKVTSFNLENIQRWAAYGCCFLFLLAIVAFVLLNQQQFTTPSWLKRFHINMTSPCQGRRKRKGERRKGIQGWIPLFPPALLTVAVETSLSLARENISCDREKSSWSCSSGGRRLWKVMWCICGH